jgi:PleD family two-component response regulator
MLAPKRPRPTESKFRLLYLGTDVKLMAALQHALTQPDYQVVACSDRESAVLFLRSKIPYDLLLIDFEWQGKNGLKLARLARSLRHRRRMPKLLVASIDLGSDLKALARRAGVNECVMKTPKAASVIEGIRRMVER